LETKVIKEKLQELKSLDKGFSLFGSSTHRYQNQSVSKIEVIGFENKFGIQLPEYFKIFLNEIGYGPGPFYGIYSLNQIDLELSSDINDLKQEGIEVSPAKPFPFTQKDLDDLRLRIEKGEKSEVANIPLFEGTLPINGCIPICHQGCTCWTYLVVNGEFSGTMWDMDTPAGVHWIPSTFSADLITFEEWYERWLSESLENIKNDPPEEIQETNTSSNFIQKILSKIFGII
jgi:hypothetical protein